jgi:hypothetical protein
MLKDLNGLIMRLNMKNDFVSQLKNLLYPEDLVHNIATDIDISTFENKHHVTMPADLKEYFKTVNGSMEYDEFFFNFQSISGFKNIDDELKYHNGVPDYSNIVNRLVDYNQCYVFCDYEFHLMTYAIRLFNIQSVQNPVYVICADNYKLIANTFSEFLVLYLDQSDKLFI